MLEFRAESKLGLTELLELRLLLARCSLGSVGFRPDCLANRFKTSVREMTPVNFPEIRESGMEETDKAPG